jgi:hypothetical protein
MTFQPALIHRRRFLHAAAGLTIGCVMVGRTQADDRPALAPPRAISGDPIEPNWNDGLTITVGLQKADLIGNTDRVIQSAVDYIARLGGGTVQLLAGTFRFRNAVYLQSHVRLVGQGADTILIKEPSRTTPLAADADWYDQEITLPHPAGFRLGDGVCLRARNPHNGGTTVIKRTLVARTGNRFKLDRPLRENLWRSGEASASSLFPLLSGENISHINIENLTLDGNKANNANLDGNYAGCIFLQDSRCISIQGVTARNYNGDGMSWQICHDVRVENCHSHDHTGLGLHPGSGSQRSIIRANKLEHNDQGIFFCWGVKDGLAEKNVITENRIGISIGHRDTDNLIRDNDIRRSGSVGVLFRGESPAFAPNRNRLENNRIVDSGPESGIGVDVQGETEAVVIARNHIHEDRAPMHRIGIRIAAKARDIQLTDNRVEGYATAISRMQ